MGKNNHFVPRRYLKRFKSISERQVALYNITSRRIIDSAAIGDQCYRNWFYTKNPAFEATFTTLEVAHQELYERMIADDFVPAADSADRQRLSVAVMFQEGRTVTTVDRVTHLTSEFVKAALRVQLEKDGKSDLVDLLPGVKITLPDAVMDAILQHLVMSPLLDDLDCTLFVNRTTEDFLTCDHPIALGNNMPDESRSNGAAGFSSRGLLIAVPISPQALVLLSDRETYKVTRNARGVAYLTNHTDVVGLNLAQCANARTNFYFSSEAGVGRTLDRFAKEEETLRQSPPRMVAAPLEAEGLSRVLLGMKRPIPRLALPDIVKLRPAAKTGQYALGNDLVRDPLRRATVRAEMDRINKQRELATERADATKASGHGGEAG